MMEYLLIAGLFTIVALAALMVALKINFLPALIAGIIVIGGINPLVYFVGSEMSKNQASSFKEYWNGYETAATRSDRACTRDGVCANTYQCDPETERVRKSRTVTDSKGKNKTEYYYVQETHWHSCPYSTQESTFTIESTVQSFPIASNVMTGQEYRFGNGIPSGLRNAPQQWLDAKARIDAGKPGPVTAVKDYQNFILASQKSLFSQYANNIEDMKSKNLLPSLSTGVQNQYQANKAYKVGDANVPLFSDYITDVAYLNGAFGKDLHGDLHVVFAPENIENGKDDYLNTLMAYWQSAAMGKNALSKNTMVVLIGVKQDGSEIAWAKAATGMPLGNEALLTQVASDLKGKKMDSNLIGRPAFDISNKSIVSSNGELEKILWGANKFSRVSMSGDGADAAGFSYLKDEMQPTGWEVFWIAFANFILGGLLIAAMVMLIINEVLPTGFAHWKGTGNRQPSRFASSYFSGYSSSKSRFMSNSYGKKKKKRSSNLWD